MDPSTLTDRLRGMMRAPAGPALPAEPAMAAHLPADAIEHVLGGEWRMGDGGRCLVVERRLAPDEPYGRLSVGEFAARIVEASAEAAWLTTGQPAPPFVFFDLETTGLSGGAGTCVFLVGCGWFDVAGGFVTRQFLLSRMGDERAMLRAVSAELGRAGALVSFNGKSFDAPMLETRYLLHRLAWVAGDMPHLDVLHPSRRFWAAPPVQGPIAAATSSCSLVSLERQVLRVARVGDVGGAEIPARYFQFVRSGDARPLAAVLEHNRLDLVSLAGLTARLLLLVAEGPDEAWDAREVLALGRIYARVGQHERAREAFERVVSQAGQTMTAVEALQCLAVAERRARRHDAAARYWQAMLDVPGCPVTVARKATEALAIHHEHRVRDLGLARNYAEKSLRCGVHPSWANAARHRLARIERKLSSTLLEP